MSDSLLSYREFTKAIEENSSIYLFSELSDHSSALLYLQCLSLKTDINSNYILILIDIPKIKKVIIYVNLDFSNFKHSSSKDILVPINSRPNNDVVSYTQ